LSVVSAGVAEYHAAGVITRAEREALELVGAGFSQRSAAKVLGVSRSAVRARVENAGRKIAAFEERRAA
jgi:predicted DNA-binding protein (UPF0251 family)